MKNRLFEGITKNVLLLGVVSLFTDISSEMLYPIIPIYLTATLGTSMSIVGIIEGIAESTASLLKVFSGWLSDQKQRRRPFIIFGYICSAFSKPLLALAGSWNLVLGSRVLDRFGKGVRTSARDALLADSIDPTYRGKAFGFHRAMDSLGAVAGPLLAIGLLSWFSEDYRPVFLIAFIPGMISVIFLFGVRDKFVTGRAVPFSFREVWGIKPLRQFLMVNILFALGNSSDVFLILKAKSIGLTTQTVILNYVLFNISFALLAFPAGILSDKFGRRRIIISGFLFFALVYLGFGFISNVWQVSALFICYGIYNALTEGVSKAYVADLVPAHQRATAIGLLYTCIGIMQMVSSTIAGLLWHQIGSFAPFVFGSVTAILSCVGFLILIYRQRAVN